MDEELRYRKRYLDLIMNPEGKDIFVKKALIMKHIRDFLEKKGFLEAWTPILQTQYGGANARPFVTSTVFIAPATDTSFPFLLFLSNSFTIVLCCVVTFFLKS